MTTYHDLNERAERVLHRREELPPLPSRSPGASREYYRLAIQTTGVHRIAVRCLRNPADAPELR
jgi:hypothetical protein